MGTSPLIVFMWLLPAALYLVLFLAALSACCSVCYCLHKLCKTHSKISVSSDSDLDSEPKIEVGGVPAEVHITLESDDMKNKDTIDSESQENELTSDNREPSSVGQENQQHMQCHAVVEVHTNDSNVIENVATVTVNNMLCIRDTHTETGVEIHHSGVQEGHKPSISIANKFSQQQQGIDAMLADRGSLEENLFDFEAVQNKMETEPDDTTTSVTPDDTINKNKFPNMASTCNSEPTREDEENEFTRDNELTRDNNEASGHTVEEERLDSTTKLNQSIDITAKGFEEQTAMESQSSDLLESLERVAALSLNFQEDFSSHNANNLDLPLHVLVSDEQVVIEADINNTINESTRTVVESTARLAFDSFEDVTNSKPELMEKPSTELEEERRNKMQCHNERELIIVTDKIKREKVLQVENVSTSEKALKAKQKIVESEISTDERLLFHPTDLEMTASRESLHEVSTPYAKLDQDANNCHSTEDHPLLIYVPSTTSRTADLSCSKMFRKHHDYEEISDFIPLTKVTQMQAGMDPGAKGPQENLNSRDKESSPNHSKYHARYQPREMVPVLVKRRRVTIKRNKGGEKIHDYYNTMCLPDSVNTDQPTKHSDNSPSHKSHLSDIRSRGILPTKRELSPTKISKEELRRRYRHRPPPPKDLTLPPQMSTGNKESISETDHEPEESCKPDHNRQSIEDDYENFGIIEVKSIEDTLITSKRKWGSQESLKKDTSNNSAITESVTVKRSSHMSEIDIELYSENETVSTNEIDSTAQKDGHKLDVKMHEIDESKENSETDKERTQTSATPVDSKQSHSTDGSKTGKDEVNLVDCESLVTYTQVQRRGCGITRQKSVETEDPESQIQTLNEKIAPIQPSSNDAKEQLVDLDSGSRIFCHNHEEKSAQDDADGDQYNIEESEPELPERGYLEDIDFVMSESDMILHTNTKLPARASLGSVYQEKQIESASCNLDEASKFIFEGNGGLDPILNNGNDIGAACRSACSTDPYDHEQLRIHAPNQWTHSEDVYVNVPQLEAQSTSEATNSSKSQYQPLIIRSRNPESQYGLAAFTPLNSEHSLQIEKALKSQKIKDANTGGQPNQEGYSYVGVQPTNVSDPNHYQPLLCKKKDKDPVYVGLSDIPHQPQAISYSTSEVPLSITCHEYEDFRVFPVKCIKKASASCKFKRKEELRKLYRHRPPPKLPTITDSKALSDIQYYTDTSEPADQYHRHEYPSLLAQSHTRLQHQSTPLPLPAQSESSIKQGVTYENINIEHAKVKQGNLVQKDQLTSSMHKPLHSTADSNRSSHHSLAAYSNSQGAYMPLIPKRWENKASYEYETLNDY